MKKMISKRRNLVLAAFGSLVAFLVVPDANAQDPVKVMPRSFRVVLENDRVRVLEFRGRPGMGICGESMHSHPPHLTIVLEDWKGQVTTADGKVFSRSKKAGDVFWSEAETHKVENMGNSTARVLHVELKTPNKN